MEAKPTILVHCSEPLHPVRLTGPAARALAQARALVSVGDVTLAVPPGSADLPGEPAIASRVLDRAGLVGAVRNADAVISQGMHLPGRALASPRGGRPFVLLDLYDPVLFELAADVSLGEKERRKQARHLQRFLGYLLGRADGIVCASPQQKHLWAGALLALGRVEGGLVRVAPFGHDGGEVRALGRPAMKGAVRGIGPNDRVLLWGGGVWDWFDPLTLIRAVAALAKEMADLRLVFLAGARPSGSPGQTMLERARRLSESLGVTGRHVFFHSEWVPYAERGAWLTETDLAVVTAPEGPENTYSFRTRLVDAVWAGVPVVCTRGGYMADFVETRGMGLTVPGGDVRALAEALRRALCGDAQATLRQAARACRAELEWSKCLAPVVEMVASGLAGGGRAESRARAWGRYLAYKTPSMVDRVFGR